MIVSRDVSDLLDRLGRDGFTPDVREREAFNTLAENGFIVENREADRRNIEDFFTEFRAGQDQLRVTVLTTLQCNFACDYCIQGDHGEYNKTAAKMSMETAARVAEWIEGRMDAIAPKSFALTFFGGEPLLNLPVVYYLAERMSKSCCARGVSMVMNVITNGLLLTPEVVDRLTPLAPLGVKVTLDGDRDTHNRMWPLRGGQGTFDKILNNVRQVADRCRISIGGNFDESSVDSYPALLDFLREQEFADKLTKVAFKPIIRETEAAAAEGVHSAHGRRRRRQAAQRFLHDVSGRGRVCSDGGRVRFVPLPRRQDGVPPRGDDQARIQDRRRRAHGTVRNPQAARPHNRPGWLALRVPRIRGQRPGVHRPHRRARGRVAQRGGAPLCKDHGVGRLQRLLVHPGLRRRLLRGSAHRTRGHEQTKLPQAELRSRGRRAGPPSCAATGARVRMFQLRNMFDFGRKEQGRERQERHEEEGNTSPLAGRRFSGPPAVRLQVSGVNQRDSDRLRRQRS